ncbi:hypothetical protein H6P81_004863 [Aristolochia fimbriata]|uniref:Bifunctional inhibitor/plant lipid transfer protein/seed storage helical domain-containing protein n=1 Tax=Aristolochia fimbriata TaxID=158543 RepID=A0AAV7EU97_ARIFI|nr:hypothetical protein H6P81_004863 [Aristolochia fimbriata]
MYSSSLAALEQLLLQQLTFLAVVFAASGIGDCGSELLAISPCLPYVAAAPNNLSSVVDPLCCDPFRAASDGPAHCVCRLLIEPDLLGFPLNLTRLRSLFSFCPANRTVRDDDSPERICRRSQSGPPTESPARESGPPPAAQSVPRPTKTPAASGSRPPSPTESPKDESRTRSPTESPPELPVRRPVSPTTSSTSSTPPPNFSASSQPRSFSSRILIKPLMLLFSFGFAVSAFN